MFCFFFLDQVVGLKISKEWGACFILEYIFKSNHYFHTMSKGLVVLNMKEDKAKALSQSLNSASSKKILDYLEAKEATESDIAKALKMAQSTVHYNLKQLEEAQLVIAEEFHYSKKGKMVNHYKLANNLVVISASPLSENFKQRLASILPALGISVVVSGLIYWFTRAQPVEQAMKLASGASFDAESEIMAEAAPMVGRAVEHTYSSSVWLYFLLGAVLCALLIFLFSYLRKK